MNSLTSSCWSSWCCRIWMRALTLEPEYWLVLAGLMRAKPASSSSDTMGGPEETQEQKRRTKVVCMAQHRHKFPWETSGKEQRKRHLFGVRSFPDRWRQIRCRRLLRCSSRLTGFFGCLCRTGPKVWSRCVSWGSQGAGDRPDHFYSSVGGDEIMQGWASFPCDLST